MELQPRIKISPFFLAPNVNPNLLAVRREKKIINNNPKI